MTPDQIADLALRAGRDMRRVERVRALLDGREWVLAWQIREALDPTHSDTCSGIVDLACERPRAVASTTVSPGASPQGSTTQEVGSQVTDASLEHGSSLGIHPEGTG